jgi:hypothetical protein
MDFVLRLSISGRETKRVLLLIVMAPAPLAIGIAIGTANCGAPFTFVREQGV